MGNLKELNPTNIMKFFRTSAVTLALFVMNSHTNGVQGAALTNNDVDCKQKICETKTVCTTVYEEECHEVPHVVVKKVCTPHGSSYGGGAFRCSNAYTTEFSLECSQVPKDVC